jgi:hypothetical protein
VGRSPWRRKHLFASALGLDDYVEALNQLYDGHIYSYNTGVEIDQK